MSVLYSLKSMNKWPNQAITISLCPFFQWQVSFSIFWYSYIFLMLWNMRLFLKWLLWVLCKHKSLGRKLFFFYLKQFVLILVPYNTCCHIIFHVCKNSVFCISLSALLPMRRIGAREHCDKVNLWRLLSL